jgi:hypothetical protein
LVHPFLNDASDNVLYNSSTKEEINGKTERIWKDKTSGFEITITLIGTETKSNEIFQNATKKFGLDIKLGRIFEPYLYQYYFPCIAIVIVSQVSFIIPLSAIPGRVALIVTQILTLTNIFIHQMVRQTTLEYFLQSNRCRELKSL